MAAEGNTIRIGTERSQAVEATYIANIYQQPVFGDNVPVLIDSTGKLGTAVGSSARFKHAVKPMGDASETILSLRPVTFRYKTDTKGTQQFGLIAEEVAKIDPALVLCDTEGKPYTVRYDAVNAMLLNEFLKEHQRVERLEAAVVHQQQAMVSLTSQMQRVTIMTTCKSLLASREHACRNRPGNECCLTKKVCSNCETINQP